ncbi:hypothetical protein ED92_39230 [Amycolatopsis sp. MJM2582]|nr:hypothetical protein ED92_39230 [Amycolatopsis sp. MJM2582]
MLRVLYARMMSTRYGITFSGLTLAAGAGVFCGVVPLGYAAMLAAVFTNPALLVALPGALVLGALAGLLVAYGTRNAIRPRMAQRYRRFVAAGLIAMPGFFFIGRIEDFTSSPEPSRWAIGFILCCGLAGIVVHYRWRKRLTLEQHARRAAENRAQQHTTVA